MKRLFLILPLLLSGVPLSAHAEPEADQQLVAPSNAGSVWLIVQKGWGKQAALEKIEMVDMNQCQMQGALWKGSTTIEKETVAKYQGFHCVEGK